MAPWIVFQSIFFIYYNFLFEDFFALRKLEKEGNLVVAESDDYKRMQIEN